MKASSFDKKFEIGVDITSSLKVGRTFLDVSFFLSRRLDHPRVLGASEWLRRSWPIKSA